MKKIWIRLGVSADVTEDELALLKADSCRPNEKENVILEIIRSGRAEANGDSYIPSTDILMDGEAEIKEDIELNIDPTPIRLD